MSKKPNGNTYPWCQFEILFIKAHRQQMTSFQLSSWLGITRTVVRNKCYELGLRKMELEYWTELQVRYLLNNYRQMGDQEIAEYFQVKWPKNKEWTRKHIRKKRVNMNLVRSENEVVAIRKRNLDQGRYQLGLSQRWLPKRERRKLLLQKSRRIYQLQAGHEKYRKQVFKTIDKRKKAPAPAGWMKKLLSEENRQTSNIDTSNLVQVRIDRKTIVWAKPGADLDAIRAKYQKRALGS